MFIHHIMTILLISISWTTNFFRVGTLVLWVHDQGCNSIDILGLAQFCAQNLTQNVAQVLSDRNTGILDLTLLGPAPIHLAQFCGPVSSPVEV